MCRLTNAEDSLSRIVFRRRRRLCVSEVQFLLYSKSGINRIYTSGTVWNVCINSILYWCSYSLSRIVFRRRRRLCVSEVQYLFYNKILTLVYDAASISYARVN